MFLPAENQSTLPGYYNRHSRASGVKSLIFRASAALQSREANDLQESIHDRISGLAGALFADGDIVKGLELIRLTDDPDGYDIQIGAGEVYAQGCVETMGEVKLNIPLNTKVSVGLRFAESVLKDNQDPGLRDPAIGSANYDNPGAWRQVKSYSWGWVADSGATDGSTGTFFPVFTIDNGVPILRNPPPAFNAVVEHVAKYDFDSHRNYAVRGLQVSFLESIGGNNHFNLSEGTGNIRGYKRTRLTSDRLVYAKDFDTSFANNEPHIFNPDGEGRCRIPLNRYPLHELGEVFGTKLKTETVSRGSFVGGSDQLSENSVLQVLEVRQGSTVYVEGDDYTVAGDDINWSPLGAEPSPSSTYEVTYHYQAVVEAVETDDTTATFEGLVAGTYVNMDYTYKLPRVDLITMDSDGFIHRIKGEPLERNPAPKQAPDNHLPLATITFSWYSNERPVVEDVRDLAVPVSELNEMKRQISDLFDLLALERLRIDMALSDPSAKHGVFVDAFKDDDLRDNGIEQNAAIIDGVLTLPFDADIHAPNNEENTSRPLMLPFVGETVISQENKTQCMKINPYAAVDPLPAKVRLVPPVDRWIEQGPDTLSSEIARHFVQTFSSKGWLTKVYTVVSFKQVGLTSRPASFIRVRNVAFVIDGFGPGEQVSEIKFDGINVTHSVNTSGLYAANSEGHAEGEFTIPPNVQLGAKTVAFTGIGGSRGEATYVADGTIVARVMQQVNTTVTSHYDPLAQTFTLPEDRILTAIALKFCALGSADNPVFVQIRETQVGIPTQDVLAEGRIMPADITLNAWTPIQFDIPVFLNAEREFAIVVLTDDQIHAVGIARLGDYVTAGNGPREGWMTAQPYQIGALLASSNASTWTPINEADLTFKIIAAKFTANTATIPLGTINGVNVTDIKPMATVVRPSAETQVDMTIAETISGKVYRTPEDRSLRLNDRVTDVFSVGLDLKGNAKLSPIIFPWPQVLTANMLNSATYYGRAVKAAVTFNATVTFSVLKSGTANVRPFIGSQLFSGGTPVIEEGVYQAEYLEMALQKQEPVGDGWLEETYTITGAKGIGLDRLTRVHLLLTGTPKFRVYARELRAIIK